LPDEKQEKAIKNSLLEENPDSIEANFAAAENYLMNGMFAEAEPHLMKALAIDEEKAYIHNHLGVVYFHQDNNGKAEQHFKRALQIEPDMIESYFNLGMLYQKQGRFKDGLPYYKAVVNYEPDNAEAFYLMGQCAMCSDMIQEAKAFFAESFRLSPTPRTAMDLVILLISQEEYPEAERVLEFLINIEDESQSNHETTNDNLFSNDEIESLRFTMGLEIIALVNNSPSLSYKRTTLSIDD
jgi:Flp pilus assembly protein TadD